MTAEAERIVPRNGVVTLSGYGISARVDKGNLILDDGIGAARRKARFSRVGHGLRRLVVIGSDGVVSLAALRWLSDQNAAFSLIDRDGLVTTTTGPARSGDAKVRRAQSLSSQSGASLVIARELISKKLAGQEKVARDKLMDRNTAQAIARIGVQVDVGETISAIRQLESQAASIYWAAWADLPICFPRNDMPRVADHWRVFGTRKSPLSGSQRLAVNPPNSMLNYLFALLEAEASLAISTLGMDPSQGVLHMDRKARNSFSCDLMEPIRPLCESFLFDLITKEPLRRDWFFEQRNGNCRLMASLAHRLSETAPIWGRAVAPFAEFAAHTFWSTTSKPESQAAPATRLTRANQMKAQSRFSLEPVERLLQFPKACVICGENIRKGRNYCASCAVTNSREQMVDVAKVGRRLAHTPAAKARRSDTQRRHGAAKKDWSLSSLPAWLTKETFQQRIQPLLSKSTHAVISTTLGVSLYYAMDIRRGRRCPHPRHWEALARLGGISQG
jgi:CRISPR-associated endonuclease Cas1